MIRLSLKIFLSVLLGAGAGFFFLPPSFSSNIGIIIDIGLMLLLFFVGMDIGKQKDVFVKIKKMGLKILLVDRKSVV